MHGFDKILKILAVAVCAAGIAGSEPALAIGVHGGGGHMSGGHMGGFSGGHFAHGHFGHGFGQRGRFARSYGGYGLGMGYGLGAVYGAGLDDWGWPSPNTYGYGLGAAYSYPGYAFGYGYPTQIAASNFCTTPVRNCDVPTAEGIGAGCACHAADGQLVEGHIAQ